MSTIINGTIVFGIIFVVVSLIMMWHVTNQTQEPEYKSDHRW
jgi:hypothetical protein